MYKGFIMLELGISQAQAQFTKILNQTVIIVDKKANHKKAVIMPYEEYNLLVSKASDKKSLQNGAFSKFVGILDKNFQTDDIKYREIIE
jgi:PHD/YefM family antitoxin component YafN of YafNO toxin-antitoxin module